MAEFDPIKEAGGLIGEILLTSVFLLLIAPFLSDAKI